MNSPPSPGRRLWIAPVAIVSVAVATLYGYRLHRQDLEDRDRQINSRLKDVQDALSHDSFAGYVTACEIGERTIAELDPDQFAAHCMLAFAYAVRWGEAGEPVEGRAREHLRAAQAAQRQHSHLIAAAAMVRFEDGDAQGALGALERAVADSKEQGVPSASLLRELGLLQARAGELEGAYANLKAAQILSPADPRINSGLGDVLRRQGQPMQAAAAYESALRYERNHPGAMVGVTLLAISEGKPEAANSFVNKVFEIRPPASPRQLAIARMARAVLLDDQNKSAEADQEEARAFQAEQASAPLFALRARRRHRAGHAEEAVASLRQAVKLDPGDVSFRIALAQELMQLPGGAKQAVSVLQPAGGSSLSPKLLCLLGDAQRSAHDLDGAADSFQKAIGRSPHEVFPEATLGLADVYRDRQDFQRALSLYEKAVSELQSSPAKQAYALVEQGKIFEASGDDKAALDKYRDAYKVESTYAPALYLIGRLNVTATSKELREPACTALSTYLQLDPKGEYADNATKLLGDHCKK